MEHPSMLPGWQTNHTNDCEGPRAPLHCENVSKETRRRLNEGERVVRIHVEAGKVVLAERPRNKDPILYAEVNKAHVTCDFIVTGVCNNAVMLARIPHTFCPACMYSDAVEIISWAQKQGTRIFDKTLQDSKLELYVPATVRTDYRNNPGDRAGCNWIKNQMLFLQTAFYFAGDSMWTIRTFQYWPFDGGPVRIQLNHNNTTDPSDGGTVIERNEMRQYLLERNPWGSARDSSG